MTPDVSLLSCVEFDPRNFQITVRERWQKHRWLWSEAHEREHTYALDAGIGWLDGDRLVTDTALSLRLFELFFAWQAEERLNDYVGISAPPHVTHAPYAIRGPLPPVPVMPRR